ncbi:MAG: aminotransferase class III-fold pyridoxal phosphate-dependent enzyme [Bdellovibrionota bacterium]
MKILEQLRAFTRSTKTHGLTNEEVEFFFAKDPLLRQAIEGAIEVAKKYELEFPELKTLTEEELREKVGEYFLSFYPAETSSPYVPLAARGPWIVTAGGAVIYDTGGYGMLGHGHDPDCIREAMSARQAMANIMTPSMSQYRTGRKLEAHIGHNHSSHHCPYSKFVFMNSGSEAMGVALRISDAHAKRMTDPDGRYPGKKIKILSFTGSFHGRTYRAARISGSSRSKYEASLASFADHSEFVELPVNDVAAFHQLFDSLVSEGCFIESLVLEPVMGEGNPGCALTREFYDAARTRTQEHGSFLIIDSIQAGLRTHGVLSVVDYPGFETCEPPDMEVYSKALNGGQYPLSVLALQAWAANEYAPGTYGNTMTAAPRALDVASQVLNACSPALAENICSKGAEFLEKLRELRGELPELILKVQGTGLLLSADISPKIPVVGFDGAEQRMRRAGMNVIHGGKNALRYTPWFLISSDEIDLIIRKTKEILLELA